MNTQIEKLTDEFRTESRAFAGRVVSGLRNATRNTAGLLVRTKQPVNTLATAGLKINSLSHEGIEKLLKQQVASFEDLVDGSARRLEMAARAKSLKALVQDQIASLPASRDAAVANARKTLEIVTSTGDGLGTVVKTTAAGGPVRKAPARKKKAGGTRGKTGSRKATPASRKKSPARGRKSAGPTKKTSARRAPAQSAA
jgi:phasin family protein